LESLLRATLGATSTKVEDVSGGCGSSYRVEVQSPKFVGLPRIKQHQMVNEALKDEIKKWHAITIITKPTPQIVPVFLTSCMVSSETPAEQGDKVASDSSASSRESTEGKSSSNKGSVDGRYTGAGDNASNASLGASRRRPSLERQSGIRYIPLGIRHDTFEVERHQRLLKTKFCRYGPNCEFARKGQCFFVHSPQELKYRPPKPIGYPVRPRGSQYDEYDDFYYGEAGNDYYFDDQYYGQGQDVSSADYERSGINNEVSACPSTSSWDQSLVSPRERGRQRPTPLSQHSLRWNWQFRFVTLPPRLSGCSC
ncbi:BolA-like protein 3, variant 2, partial [Perkinsus olseni]